MLVTQANQSVMEGATVAVLDTGRVKGLIRKYPLLLFELLGPRFQNPRAAAFRFSVSSDRLKNSGTSIRVGRGEGYVEKLSHSDLSKMIGVYRETTTKVLTGPES